MNIIINKNKDYTVTIVALIFNPDTSKLFAHITVDNYDNKIELDNVDVTKIFTSDTLTSIREKIQDKITELNII